VSLYNETEGRAILPTPVLGIVGLIEDQSAVVSRPFPSSAGSLAIVLIGENRGEMGGSEYLDALHGLQRGVPPAIDLAQERAVQTLLPRLTAERLIRSAHDVSEGGVAVALAECCFDTGGRGAEVDLPTLAADVTAANAPGVPALHAALFGESMPQVLVSVDPAQADVVVERARAAGVPARVIGRTGGTDVIIRVAGQTALTVGVAEAEHEWSTSIERALARREASVA
jgi:phosphoribosylformylglycinamidine synthase subunit PurL